jgi:2OG-Fe(II) oxygenase superfamily
MSTMASPEMWSRDTSIIDLEIAPVRHKPFEHVLKENFINPELYTDLVRSFPKCPPSTGPTGYSTYWGDEQYDKLIVEYSSWKALFNAFHSQEFIDYCVRQFGNAYRSQGCLVDLSKARYVPYLESRADKEARHIAKVEHETHELWVRVDIHQGLVGYTRRPHVDHRRRLVSMLIYMCDADQNHMVGGDLVLHRGKSLFSSDLVIRPKHNRMAVFPCHSKSIHSVPEIKSEQGPRNFLQVTVSSSTDAWSP